MDMSEHITPNRRRNGGFNLIEVTVAIGIVAFAFVAILGLIPIGMTTFRQAMNTSVCSQIGQQVMNDVQETDWNDLMSTTDGNPNANNPTQPYLLLYAPPGTTNGQKVRYFDYQGNELAPNGGSTSPTGTLYWVETRITPNASLPVSTGTYNNSNLATVTIQVIDNPGNVSPTPDNGTTSPTYLLWNDARFIPYTYTGIVAATTTGS